MSAQAITSLGAPFMLRPTTSCCKLTLERIGLHTYAAGEAITIGPLGIGPYHGYDSIPGPVGLGITTPAGLIVHSGHVKFDATPVDGWPAGQARLAEFSSRGVLGRLSERSNADRPSSRPSEAALDATFHQIMREAPGIP
jgi:ribonuclease J